MYQEIPNISFNSCSNILVFFPQDHRRQRTLQECNISAMARRLRLAVAMMSSWRQELPAATALAVAMVMPLVVRMNSSGVVVLNGGSELQNTYHITQQSTIKGSR